MNIQIVNSVYVCVVSINKVLVRLNVIQYLYMFILSNVIDLFTDLISIVEKTTTVALKGNVNIYTFHHLLVYTTRDRNLYDIDTYPPQSVHGK